MFYTLFTFILLLTIYFSVNITNKPKIGSAGKVLLINNIVKLTIGRENEYF